MEEMIRWEIAVHLIPLSFDVPEKWQLWK